MFTGQAAVCIHHASALIRCARIFIAVPHDPLRYLTRRPLNLGASLEHFEMWSFQIGGWH
jgi:hypothetical protein